jgi:branched-chain amino acid transport system substrate-binding protein
VILDFNKPHQQKFGEPANYYSAEMVDAIDIIAAALKVVPSADGEKLRDAIEKIKGLVGMNGIYTFSATDHHGTVLQDMMVLTIKDGKWQVLLK